MTVPSFATPNTLALRPLQQALDNIREGLKQVDARLVLVSQQTGQTAALQSQSGGASTADLRRQVTQLRTDLEALTAQLNALTGAAAAQAGPAVMFGLDGQDGQDGTPVPGPQGPPGQPGPIIFMNDGQDGEDGFMIIVAPPP